MTESAAVTQNAPAKWQSLIATLTNNADACDREAKELANEREGLLLNAELGTNGAAKRVAELDDEIAQRSRESAQKREAIRQARTRLADARQTEAAKAEYSRF